MGPADLSCVRDQSLLIPHLPVHLGYSVRQEIESKKVFRPCPQHLALDVNSFEEKDLRELRKLDLISFKEKLEASGIHGKTLKNYLDNLKTFLRYCRDDLEVIPGFPKMPEVDVSAAEFKWLSQKDQAALFEMIPESDRPIFAFMMLQGARSGEARALRAKDIDLKTGMVTISATFSGKEIREKRKGKKAKAVTATIHPEIYDFIAGRVRGSLPGAFVFVNPRTGRLLFLPAATQGLGRSEDQGRNRNPPDS